jgi:TamB, inner membrane protein subunit of TAM complex
LLKKWIIVLLLLLVVLVIAANLLLNSGFYSEKLKGAVVSPLEALTGRTVQVQQVRLHLFPFYLLLEGLTFIQPSGISTPPVTVAQARIAFSPWSLFTEVFVINKISLIEPAVHLVEPSELSGSPLKALFPSAGSAAGESPEAKGVQRKRVPVLAIRAVEISGGHLFVNHPDGSPHLEFSRFSSLIEPDLLMQNFRIVLKTGTIQVTDPRWNGSLDQLEGALVLHPGELEIKHLAASSKLLSATIRGMVKMDRPASMTIHLETVASLMFLRQLFELKRDWTGEARFTGEVTGSYPDLVIKGPVSVRQLVLDRQPIGNATASLSYQGQVLTLADLAGGLLSGEAHGDITLKLTEAPFRYDLALQFENLHADTLPTLLSHDLSGWPEGLNLNGKMLSGKLSLSGSGMGVSTMSGDGSLSMTQGRQSESTPSDSEKPLALFSAVHDGAIRFHTSQGRWEIGQADFRTPRSSLNLQGSIDSDHTIHFIARLITQRLNELTVPLGHPELDGKGTLTGTLTGNLTDPKGYGEIALESLTIHDHPLGSFFSRFQYRKPLLALSRVVIRHGESLTTGRGKLNLQTGFARPTFELQVSFARSDPQGLLALMGKEFSMTTPFSGKVKLRSDARKLSGEGTLTLGHGQILNQPIQAGEISMKVSDDLFRITSISLKTKKSMMEGVGFLAMDGRYFARLKSFNFHLEDFEWLHIKLPALQGHGPITIHGSGNLKDPVISAQVTLKDMKYAGRDLGEGRIELQVARHQAKVEVSSDTGLKLKGTLQIASPFPYGAELTVTSIQLDPWIALWYPSAVSKIKIQSSGVFQLKGDLEHLNDLEVQARLPNLLIDLAGYRVSNDGEIEAAYDRGQLAIRSFKLKGEGTSLTILGRVRFEHEYDLLITGEADLGLLQLITPEIPYGNGKTYLAMRLYDRWKDPKLQGGLILRDGTIRIGGLFQTMTIHSLGIAFDERQLLLESLDGEIGKGHLEGTGKAELKNLHVESFGLLLEVTDLVVPSFYGFNTTMDGTLVFQGTPNTKDLRGEINIKQALYEKRSDIKAVAVSAPGTKPEAPKSGDLPLFGDTALNIHLSGKDHLWVNNNLAKLPLQVDLVLRGTLNHPIVLGRIEALDGLAFLRKNEFKVTTAVVEFINPERPKPVFEIEANTVIRKYRISIRLSGTLDRFRVNLTSDPSLNDTDLFSLLLVGKTAKEVTQAGQGLGVAETPLLIPEAVQRRLLATTGRFFMQSSSSHTPQGEGKSPRFAIVKKMIGDKLFLIYAVNLETSEEHLIRIEHRMGENLTLVGERDPESGMSHEILVRVKSKA